MRYLRFVLIIFILMSLSNCEKEALVLPKDYPYVITNSPIVNTSGVELSADITNTGNQKILKYGFVWSTEPNPTIQDYYKLFEGNVSKGIYSCNINSGLAKGQTYYVRAYVLTYQYKVYGNVKSFISQGSLPPIVNDFEPKFGNIGTEVVIDGNNFGLSKNSNMVKFGNIEVSVVSVTENRLVVKTPIITKPERVPITIETAGMSATSQDSFDLWFPWKKLGAYNKDLNGATAFPYGNKGYVIPRNSNTLLEYNPNTNSFKSHSTLPEWSSWFPLAAYSATKAIVLLNDNVYEIDLNTLNWSLITNYSGERTQLDYLYYINNEIYIGSLENKHEKEGTLFKYNAKDNIWESITASNVIRHLTYDYSYGSYNNFGYIYYWGGVSRFDPSDNTWKYFTEFPFASGYGSCQFYIDNNLYAGFGYVFDWGEGYASNQIWEYNLNKNIWTRYNDCPQRMHVALSLTIAGKGYAFSSNGPYYEKKYEVWEFDPTKN